VIEFEASPVSTSPENPHFHEVPSCRVYSRGRDSRRSQTFPFEARNDSRHAYLVSSSVSST